MALALSPPSTSGSSAQPWDPKACSAAFSAQSEHLILSASSSEVLNVLSIEASDLGDSPAHSPQYEELVEVVTCAVVKVNIEWPAERQEACKKCKFDERFLHLAPQPPCRG